MAYVSEPTPSPTFDMERRHMRRLGGRVAGVDEAGRGPWAGPVVAAAVILDPHHIPDGLDDSKRLRSDTRDALFDQLTASATIGVGIADVARIDRDNILQATMWAMTGAIADLGAPPAIALIDGNRCPDCACPTEAIVKGDARSLSIAAASIIAKVTRDRLMRELANAFPGYGWERNKGYGTADHSAGIRLHGVTPHHRRSFRPVREALERTQADR